MQPTFEISLIKLDMKNINFYPLTMLPHPINRIPVTLNGRARSGYIHTDFLSSDLLYGTLKSLISGPLIKSRPASHRAPNASDQGRARITVISG